MHVDTNQLSDKFKNSWEKMKMADLSHKRRCLGLPVDQTKYLGAVQIQGLVLFYPFLNKYPVLASIIINQKA